MAKFKIGDRVRAISTSGGGGVQKGDVFIVTKNDDDYLSFFNHRVGRSDGWGASCFEHALTITPGQHYRTRYGKPTGRVTVGDTGFEAVVDGRVRVFDSAGGAVHGDDDIVEAWVPKVGERVRFVRDNTDGGAEYGAKGEVVTVMSEASDIGNCQVDVSSSHLSWNPGAYLSDIEPLPVASPQPAEQEAAAFKVGDKVSICDRHPYILSPNEHTGVVVSTNGCSRGRVQVEIDNYGGSLSFLESELSLRNSETPATNVGAQVDTLAEEYGPAVREPRPWDRYSTEAASDVANDNLPVDEQQAGRALIRTRHGYGFEIARFGDYVWIDTGKKAPETFRASSIPAA